MLRHALLLGLCFGLPGCFLGGSKGPDPYYQTAGIRIFKTSPDSLPKGGGYTFGGLLIEGVAVKKRQTDFVLVMQTGRDQNQNGLLESEEIIDTDRIQDGTLPFTFRTDPQHVPPGEGRAMHQVRLDFADREPFRFERKEPGRAVTGAGK